MKRVEEKTAKEREVRVGRERYLHGSVDLRNDLCLSEKSSWSCGSERKRRWGKRSANVASSRKSKQRGKQELTIVSRHHDLDELDDVSSLKLGIFEQVVELVSGRDSMVPPLR